MVRIGLMASPKFLLNRRELMAGLGTVALGSARSPIVMAQGRPALALQLKTGDISLRSGGPETQVWSIAGSDFRLKRGEVIEIGVGNGLPVPAVLNWRGIDGAGAAEPLTGRTQIAPGGRDTFQIAPRHAGTYLYDLSLLGDGAASPSRGRSLIVGESESVAVDRDEVF